MKWQLHRYKNKKNGVWFDVAQATKIPEGPFLSDTKQYHRMRMDLYDREHRIMRYVLLPYLLIMAAIFIANYFYFRSWYVSVTIWTVSVPVNVWKDWIFDQYNAKRAYYDALAALAKELENNRYNGSYLRWW